MQDGTPSSRDTVFLAVTRPATFYGVPLTGFLIAASVASLAFNVTHQHGLLWRAVLVGGPALLILGIMRALTSWEPNWWAILATWAVTSGRVRLSWPTRAFGGATLRPWPVALRHERRELRDYRG